MSAPVLVVGREGALAIVTLNRPEALNALSRELRAAATAAFRELAADPEVRVAILTGAGRAFCAGLDLKELGRGEDASHDGGGLALIDALRAFPGPLIAAVNGYAVTGGFELALACDLIVASSEARFADTHARVGIVPGWGLSQRLPRLIGIGRAKELAFTGNYIDAQQALAWGLVNRVVPPAELLPTCKALAADILSCDPRTLRTYKRVIDAGYASTLADGLALEGRASAEHARGLLPRAVEERRREVLARGREQSKRPPGP
jgi:enoyl-CoA hydratase